MSLDSQRLAERRDEPLDGELAVPGLAAFVLRDGPDDRTYALQDVRLLRGCQAGGGLDVERRLNPCLGLLRVLATGSARA